MRTPASLAELTKAAAEDGVVFAGAVGGGYVFPEFLPAYDAVASLCKLLELLAPVERPLSELVAELPASTLVHRQLAVPVGAEGARHAGADRAAEGPRARPAPTGSRPSTSAAGRKVLPDPDEPVVHIYAEGETEEASLELARELIDLVEEIMQSEEAEARV